MEKPQQRVRKYLPGTHEQARKLAEFGATLREIGEFFEISERSVINWMHWYPEFAAAVKTGKDIADDRVEQSLYRRALGYRYDAKKVFLHEGKPVIVEYEEVCPPDTTACIFWLKNRRKDEWRDRHNHELTGKDGEALPALLVSFVGENDSTNKN